MIAQQHIGTHNRCLYLFYLWTTFSISSHKTHLDSTTILNFRIQSTHHLYWVFTSWPGLAFRRPPGPGTKTKACSPQAEDTAGKWVGAKNRLRARANKTLLSSIFMSLESKLHNSSTSGTTSFSASRYTHSVRPGRAARRDFCTMQGKDRELRDNQGMWSGVAWGPCWNIQLSCVDSFVFYYSQC